MGFLKEDKMGIGIALGLLVPAFFIAVLYYGTKSFHSDLMADQLLQTYMLFSIALNLILMRVLMLRKKKDKVGRGILLSTFVGAFIYFYMFMGEWV